MARKPAKRAFGPSTIVAWMVDYRRYFLNGQPQLSTQVSQLTGGMPNLKM